MPEIPVRDLVGRLVRSEHRAEFGWCDAFRHVGSAAWLELAVNHRVQAVRDQLGFDTLDYAERTGHAFVVRSAHLHFDRAVRAGEELAIESWIEAVGRSSMTIQIHVLRRADGLPCCRVTFHSALLDLARGQPLPIPAALPSTLSSLSHLPWAEGHPRPAA